MEKHQLTHRPPPDPAITGAPQPGEVAHRGPGTTQMSRIEWKTVAIQQTVYEEIAKNRVPTHSKSVQSYVHHWVRIGLLIDAALEQHDDKGSVAERIIIALSELNDASG